MTEKNESKADWQKFEVKITKQKKKTYITVSTEWYLPEMALDSKYEALDFVTKEMEKVAQKRIDEAT